MQGLTNYLWNLKVGRIWASRLQHWHNLAGCSYYYYVSLGIKGSYEEPKYHPNIIDRHKLYIYGKSWTVE
jgi:hypothetical protein